MNAKGTLMKKRLGIVAFYQKDGNVDEYFLFLLQELKKCLDLLVVICNGIVSEDAEKRMLQYADEVYKRANQGYDAAAFKEGMLLFLGKDVVKQYDEIVLCNDTFFGPFVSFDEMFAEMECRGKDFWGLSAQPESIDFWTGTSRIIPAFIQTFFLVIGSELLHDERFWSYWENLDATSWNVTQVVVNHEQYFTHYFEQMGFSWDVYMDMSIYSSDPKNNNYTGYLVYPYELIKYGKAVFLKKKCITGNDIGRKYIPENGSLKKALVYIKDSLKYNERFIIDFIVQNCTKETVAEKLLSPCIIEEAKCGISDDEFKKILLVVMITSEATAEVFRKYMDMIKQRVECHVLCEKDVQRKLQLLKEDFAIHYHELENGVVEFDKFVKEISTETNAEYVGILKDNCNADECTLKTITFFEEACDNVVFSKDYISNVIEYFKRHFWISGLIAEDEKTPSIVRQDRVNCNISNGWYRSAIWKQDEIHYFERLYNKAGVGLKLQNSVKSIEWMIKSASFENNVTNVREYIEQDFLYTCRRDSRIYIYGAGGVGCRTAHKLEENGISFAGFVVSDGQAKERELLGHPVLPLGDLEPASDEVLMIIAVEERLYPVIKDNLNNYNYNNIIYSCF